MRSGCGRPRSYSALKLRHPTRRGLQIWLLQKQEALRRYWLLCPLCKAMPNALRNHKRMSTLRNSRSLYVESEHPRSIHFVSHTEVTVAGSLVNNTLDFIYFARHGRSKAVCCDDVEGKGQAFIEGFACARLTLYTDYVRPRSASPTVPASSARLDSQPPDYLS